LQNLGFSPIKLYIGWILQLGKKQVSCIISTISMNLCSEQNLGVFSYSKLKLGFLLQASYSHFLFDTSIIPSSICVLQKFAVSFKNPNVALILQFSYWQVRLISFIFTMFSSLC